MIIPFKCNKVRLTSPFGDRVLNGIKQNHTGYDLVGVGSHDVCAAVGGKVIHSRIITDKNNATWQWGNYVCIKGNDGLYYYYCHMKSRAVTAGQIVNAGDKLGVMGNTGYSFGAHLHFEVRSSDGKTKINPETILEIPNKTGTYTALSQFETDIDILAKKGIINSPDYWKAREKIDKYFPALIHNLIEHLN